MRTIRMLSVLTLAGFVLFAAVPGERPERPCREEGRQGGDEGRCRGRREGGHKGRRRGRGQEGRSA